MADVSRSAKASEPLAPGVAAAAANERPADANSTRRRRALLVGCTTYDHFDVATNLEGPGNDVALFRDVLIKQFGFDNASIVTLAEGNGLSARPTYVNIKREFGNLAKNARDGYEVVILLSGHGLFVPDVNPNENDPEPDGRDECFLPADTERYNETTKTLGKIIRDDELREWLTAIHDRGAFVWIIVDSCHSGSATRAPGDFPRQIMKPEYIGLPPEVEKEWKSLGEKARGGDGKVLHEHLLDAEDKPGSWVAMYAAQPNETAPELLLPGDVEYKKRKMHGLLTYSICRLLSQSSGQVSYGQLMERIQQHYTSTRGIPPTPAAEGPGLDREVLGERELLGRSRLKVSEKEDRLIVNGGTIHGLSNGCILAIYRGPDGAGATGEYIKLTACTPFESEAEWCDAEGKPSGRFRVQGEGYVRIARFDNSFLQATVVGIDPLDGTTEATNLVKRIQTAGEEEGAFPKSMIEFHDRPVQADWVVRTLSNSAFLVPSSGWPNAHAKDELPAEVFVPGPEFGPFRLDDPQQFRQLVANLGTIAKAQNLLRLAPPPDGSKLISGPLNVQMELRHHAGTEDLDGVPLNLGLGTPMFQPGEMIGFHITNNGLSRIDVTLLFVDAAYGIKPWYPTGQWVGDNRIESRKTLKPKTVPRLKVTAETTGLEHIVLIAVPAQDPAVDFTWLAQRGVSRPRGGEQLRSLNELFGYAVERKGTRGGQSAEEGGTPYIMRTITWRVPGEPMKLAPAP